MRTYSYSRMALLLAVAMTIFINKTLFSQQFSIDNSKSNLTIYGTSSLHDWDEKAERQSGSIQLSNEESLTINNLNVSVEAESLKSHKSGMDKNTYKALKTDKYKSIDFKMVSLKQIKDLGNSTYQVTVSGKLTITGVTKTIDLSFKMKISSSMVTLEGETTFNMSEYGIDPPTALFGTITTGDEITIKFKSILTN